MTNGTDAVDKAVLAIDIATLGFPERLQRSLHAAGVKKVADLLGFSGGSLKKLRNVGNKDVRTVGETLARFGLSLIEDPPPPPRHDEAVSLSEIHPVLAGLLSGACRATPQSRQATVDWLLGLGRGAAGTPRPAWLRRSVERALPHLATVAAEAWPQHGQGLYRRRLCGANRLVEERDPESLKFEEVTLGVLSTRMSAMLALAGASVAALHLPPIGLDGQEAEKVAELWGLASCAYVAMSARNYRAEAELSTLTEVALSGRLATCGRIPSEPGCRTEGLKPADEMIEYAASVFVGLMQAVAVLRQQGDVSDAEVALLTRLGPRIPAPGE